MNFLLKGARVLRTNCKDSVILLLKIEINQKKHKLNRSCNSRHRVKYSKTCQNGKTAFTAAILVTSLADASLSATFSVAPTSQNSVNSCKDFSLVVGSFFVIFRMAIFICKNRNF